MRLKGICVQVALLVITSTLFASISLAQHPAFDPHAVPQTRTPQRGGQSPATNNFTGNNGKSSTSTTSGGSPYTVGPTITPTTTVPELDEAIAVDPSSLFNLVAVTSDFSLNSGANTTKFAVSFGNGNAGTWSEGFVPLVGGLLTTGDSLTWDANSNPAVAIDKQGNVFVADLYLNRTNSANGLYVSVGQLTSSSLGFSAAATHPVAVNPSTSSPSSEDKDWIAVDNSSNAATSGNVYLAWAHFDSGFSKIIFSRSADHGSHWSTPVQLSSAAQDGAVQGPQVAVGPNGEIYVVYEVFFLNNLRGQFLVKSTDGGQTFSPPNQISPTFNELGFGTTYRTLSFPSLAVSPANGDVYVVYADQPDNIVGAEVEFIASIDGGITFTQPVALDNPSKGNQFFPSIAVDETGEIHVAWFDTRNDFKNTKSYDIYGTNSTSRGGKFSTNARITAASINTSGTSYVGDYMGIAAAAGYAHPVWTSGGFNSGSLQTATLH